MTGLLATPGHRFTSLLLACTALMVCLFASPMAVAADANTNPHEEGKSGRRFATVWRIQGDVTASSGNPSKVRQLKLGDPVYVLERVEAAASAEVVLKTEDAGVIAVRPGAAFVAERFVANGKGADSATFRVLAGGLRMITGWIGRSNRQDYRVVTPTATIGIRGTDHEPYVVGEDLGATLAQLPGTYDKVNRGGTTLTANDNAVDINPGKVGFVRKTTPSKTRALMTLVLPVILAEVPGFYVPGQFDAELDTLSANADDAINRQLKEMGKPAVCNANDVGNAWLQQLDGAVTRRDAVGIMQLFAPGVTVRATVRSTNGVRSTLDIGRQEFAQSTVAAVTGLTEYKQRRLTVQSRRKDPSACDKILVKSVVIEQGKQNGKAYRFDSTETFELELQDGQWLATQAATVQR